MRRDIKDKKTGFTLAEVLITLGVIGIVAAITIPLLVGKWQKNALKNQFIHTYALLQQAWLKSEADLEYKPDCYYWSTNPYGAHSCVQWNAAGECSKYLMANGDALPPDINGNFGECPLLADKIISNLKIIKTCSNNAFSNGCIPEYEGNDTVLKSNNSSLSDYDITKSTSGCGGWRKSYIKVNASAHVIENGAIIIGYGTFRPNIFAVDVNGKKGPNKWGHDVFGFQTAGIAKSGGKIIGGGCVPTEKGGTASSTMIINITSKN